MRDFFSKFGLLVIFTLFLVACKPVENPVVTPTSTASVAKTSVPTLQQPTITPPADILVDPKKLEGLQIHFLHPWTEDTATIVAQMVDQFNQTNEWKIHVIATAPGSAGLVEQNYLDNLAANNSPDLIVAPLSLFLQSDRKKGNIVDLNPYVLSKKYGFSETDQADFLPAFWEEDISGGKRFGIPAQRTAEVLFYNLSWATELGLSAPPATFAEFKEQVCAANAAMRKDSDQTNDGLGGWIINTNALTTLSWLQMYEGNPLLQGKSEFSSPNAEKTLTDLLKLQTEGCAWLSRLPQPYEYFTSRQALIYSGPLQDLIMQEKTNTRLASADDWTILTYPHAGERFLLTEGNSYAVLQTTDEEQLASWLFIHWLSQPTQQARILQASGTLPLGANVQELLPEFRESNPVWNETLQLLPFIKPNTPLEYSNIYKMVLEDAAWQLYQTGLKTEQVPRLLTQLDQTIQEIVEQNQ
jgi:multiple sugar transport system substrate-binding protein